MPVIQADLENKLVIALQNGREANNGEPSDQDIAKELAAAIVDWLTGSVLTVPGDATLTSPSGPVTGTIQITGQ